MGNLTEAVKALFGNTKESGTYVPLVTSNGTADGNISMANLASVLGGVNNIKITNLTDKTSITINMELDESYPACTFLVITQNTNATLANKKCALVMGYGVSVDGRTLTQNLFGTLDFTISSYKVTFTPLSYTTIIQLQGSPATITSE